MSTRALRCSNPLIRGNLRQDRSIPLAHRQYSSITPRRLFTPLVSTSSATTHQSSRALPATQLLRYSSPLLAYSLSIRFASTTPYKAAGSVADSVSEPGAAPIHDILADPAEIIASVTKPQIEPHIGFLKELGLDFGWGPTAFMEWSLEHVHVLLGTPWWATLILTTLAIRVVLFKTYTGASDNSARLLTVQPHIIDLKSRLEAAKQARDMPAMMQGTQEMRNVYAAAGVKMWKNFLPFLQIPLGFGMFRLTRNMAYLPVPGLEDGGALWFCDLTVSDPYFLLPMTTGIATFYMFKFGGEAGAATTLPPLMLKGFQWGLPILSTTFMAFWPAAMQVVFGFTSILAMIQAILFRQPWFRNFLQLHPMPLPRSPASRDQTRSMTITTTARTRSQESAAPAQGLVAGATSKFKNFVEDNQQRPSGGRSKAQIAEAKRYEDRRTREIQREKHEAEQERQRRRYEKKR